LWTADLFFVVYRQQLIRFERNGQAMNVLKCDRWDIARHLKDSRICDTFLSVAEDRYPDLILRVRSEIARAMSGWLVMDGYRAEVRWSSKLDCFVGRVNPLAEDAAYFQGETPAEVQAAFTFAVQEMLRVKAPQLLTGETHGVTEETEAISPVYPTVVALEAPQVCDYSLVPKVKAHHSEQLQLPGTYPLLLMSGKLD
jgi:hypothetical protein